jgi:hypothetical protein
MDLKEGQYSLLLQKKEMLTLELILSRISVTEMVLLTYQKQLVFSYLPMLFYFNLRDSLTSCSFTPSSRYLVKGIFMYLQETIEP